jgi:transposase InsO family protein
LVLGLRKQLTEDGHDAGAETIGWHLTHHHHLTVSRATIHRILTRHGAVTAEQKKRPKSSYVRFEAAMPNQTWQSDFTHYPLTDTTTFPKGVEIITWLDDCTRYALHISAHAAITTPIVTATFRETAAQHGIPASTLTDIQSRWATIRGFRSTGRKDRGRPAPARHRCLTDWSATRLLAC